MLFFTRNDTSVVKEEEIKKTIDDKNGKVLLHINITYPSFLLKEKDRLKINAQPFYEKSAKNFQRFAESELLERAKALAEKEKFRPLGAVMRYTNSYESKNLLSIYTDVSVYDGVSEQNQLRSSQLWNKDKGYIYSFSDVFTPETRDYLLSRFSSEGNSGVLSAEDYKKCIKHFFVENNFFLMERAAAFFYPSERLGGKQGIKVFFVELETLLEKKFLKISM